MLHEERSKEQRGCRSSNVVMVETGGRCTKRVGAMQDDVDSDDVSRDLLIDMVGMSIPWVGRRGSDS